MNYQTGLAKLTGRNRDSRKLANNTYLQRRENGILAIRLHSTDILLYAPNGDVTLQTGGWKTVTTKARINEYLEGFRISQSKGQWYLVQGSSPDWDWRKLGIYQDGCTIHAGGTVTGLLPLTAGDAALKLRKKVRKYANDYVVALRAGKVTQPSNGDCWGCLMQPTDKHARNPLGGQGHILSHIKEGYFVPSLMVRAFDEFGASIAMKDAAARLMAGEPGRWPDFIYPQIAKTIARYCLREIGQAA